ncbi:MAG: biotin/lipoyl-containing protein, partial [Pseudomonadota bacterium]
MGQFVIKLPDVGEGVAEAELVEWLVEEGRNVREDDVLASVMTDKATVEIPSPVEGKITWLGPKVGDVVAVGSAIIRLEIDGAGNLTAEEAVAPTPDAAPGPAVNGANGANGAAASAAAKPPPPAPAVEPTPAQPAPNPVAPVRAAASPVAGAPRAEGEKPLA